MASSGFGDARAAAVMHLSAARLHHMAREYTEAEAAYRAALEVDPNLTAALFRLGSILLESRRSAGALELFDRVVAVDPLHADAHYFRGTAFTNLGKAAEAEQAFRDCLRLQPQHFEAQRTLGRLLHKLGRSGEARTCLEAAATIRPDDANGHLDLGNLYVDTGAQALATAQFRHAAQLRPVTSIAARGKPAFSVAFLWAPGAANTPVHYLAEDAPFDVHFVMAVDGHDPREHLRAHGDVIMNLLCDVDRCGRLLDSMAVLLDGVNKPVLNPVRKILATGRDEVAGTVAQIAGCRTARMERRTASELAVLAALQGNTPFPEPFLVRQAGTHGGDAFDMVGDALQLEAFIAAHGASQFYTCDYIDYRSADGYFRKYRMIVAGGRSMPYHLAIGTHWKVHHFRTDMANQAWMQQEEEAFLRAPESVLTADHRAALDAVARALGLDFCGIDFAIDRHGRLVVFEANAAMLVQPDDSKFAYKAAVNARIKAAFQDTLAEVHRASTA